MIKCTIRLIVSLETFVCLHFCLVFVDSLKILVFFHISSQVFYFLEYCVHIGTLDRDENLGECGNSATYVIMENRESDSREEVFFYDAFGDSNMIARMVDDLGQSVGNVGTNIC